MHVGGRGRGQPTATWGRYTTTANRASNGTQGDASSGVHAGPISADGRFIAFASSAQNLTSHGTASQVFVHDRDADGDGVFDERGAIATTWITPGSGPFQTNVVSAVDQR